MKQNLRFVLTLLLSMVLPLTAMAYDVKVAGVYYNLNKETKTAEVTSGDTEYSGTIFIPNAITNEGVAYTVTKIGDDAFYYNTSLKTVNISNSVTSIGDRAFYYCPSLTAVNMPNSIETIGKWAFSDCSSLQAIKIPNSVISVGELAFFGCSKLTDVSIGNSVTSIGQKAFGRCTSLATVKCEAETPPTCGADVFDGAPIISATLYVPEASLTAYITTDPWSSFSSIMALSAAPTAIEAVQGETDSKGVAPAYRLSGQRVAAPKGGLCISRGKIVIAK